jgi:hypothetical protein
MTSLDAASGFAASNRLHGGWSMRALSPPVAFLLVAFASAADAAPPHWAQWRGPDGQGVASDASVPLEWSPAKNVLWKSAIPGRGHSSPVVWGDRIFLTTAVEGDVVPGAQPVKHVIEGQEFVNSFFPPGFQPFTIADYEAVIEASYRAQITAWWTLQPDIQWVIHPGGSEAISDAVVFLVMTTLRF